MNARELRIGNLVYEDDNNVVLEIDEWDLTNIGTIKPIPLTEEWLVKLKMEHNESLTKGNGTYWFTLITPHTPITYVHQLQNLYFALTGEELKIKKI